jgi:hypothetical protein
MGRDSQLRRGSLTGSKTSPFSLVTLSLLLSHVSGGEPPRLDRKGPRFVYVGLTIFLLSGWYAGVLTWSSAFRPRLIAAADILAHEQPYCIEVDGRPVRTADDLTGLRMRARNEGGWSYNFHALLLVGAGADRSYLNWSYGAGRFEAVNLAARFALHLDDRVTCKPAMHFALNLR